MPLLSAPALTRFAEQILMAAGVPAHKAEVTARCLIASNLRGVDSHGMQLLPFYIDQILAGEDRDHAAAGERRRRIDAQNFRMRMRRAHEGRMGLAGPVDTEVVELQFTGTRWDIRISAVRESISRLRALVVAA